MTKTLVGTPDPEDTFNQIIEANFPEERYANAAWIEANSKQLLAEPQYVLWPYYAMDARTWKLVQGLATAYVINPTDRTRDDLFEAMVGLVRVLADMHPRTKIVSFSTLMDLQDSTKPGETTEKEPVVTTAGGQYL
jgi:hypothetical protein